MAKEAYRYRLKKYSQIFVIHIGLCPLASKKCGLIVHMFTLDAYSYETQMPVASFDGRPQSAASCIDYKGLHLVLGSGFKF